MIITGRIATAMTGSGLSSLLRKIEDGEESVHRAALVVSMDGKEYLSNSSPHFSTFSG